MVWKRRELLDLATRRLWADVKLVGMWDRFSAGEGEENHPEKKKKHSKIALLTKKIKRKAKKRTSIKPKKNKSEVQTIKVY